MIRAHHVDGVFVVYARECDATLICPSAHDDEESVERGQQIIYMECGLNYAVYAKI